VSRRLLVRSAQIWFDGAKSADHEMAERLLYMENALNHTENALAAAHRALRRIASNDGRGGPRPSECDRLREIASEVVRNYPAPEETHSGYTQP
jgi:hypothetical protein